jgi:hypothetical protein
LSVGAVGSKRGVRSCFCFESPRKISAGEFARSCRSLPKSIFKMHGGAKRQINVFRGMFRGCFL